MVTEKDLYVGLEFEASSQTNFDSKYKITSLNNKHVCFFNMQSKEEFKDWSKSDILNSLNLNTWRIAKPINKIYETW